MKLALLLAVITCVAPELLSVQQSGHDAAVEQEIRRLESVDVDAVLRKTWRQQISCGQKT